MKRSTALLCAVLPLIATAGCGGSSSPAANPPGSSSHVASTSSNAGSQPIGKRTKFSGCTGHLPLPDPACTPGAIFPAATKAQICVPGYSRGVRHVSSSTKRRAYEEYGIMTHKPFSYEVDHLISLELGGSNSIANLWPEPASPVPGYHQKDQVENYLHAQVCNGALSLVKAQRQIAHNWIAVYHQMGH